jgi:uncharacterized membrane protein
MNTFIIFVTSFISYIVLDLLWLGFIAKPLITKWLAPWMTDGFKLWPAAIVYALLALGTTFFIIPKMTSLGMSFIWGALLGLIIYGVYDMTNLATIANWPTAFAFVDMAWGIVSGGLVAMVIYWISRFLK